MPDLEEVISALECISNGAKQPCCDCEYSKREEWCIAECAKDAIALLKQQAQDLMDIHADLQESIADNLRLQELVNAQEPVKPIIETHWETPSVYDEDVKVTENKCGACGAEIDKWDKFCRVCGRAVKWE